MTHYCTVLSICLLRSLLQLSGCLQECVIASVHAASYEHELLRVQSVLARYFATLLIICHSLPKLGRTPETSSQILYAYNIAG